jgi:hypothetical protein
MWGEESGECADGISAEWRRSSSRTTAESDTTTTRH